MIRSELVVISIVVLAACGSGLRDNLRRRAAADLSCPPGGVTVSETGLGGWHATGCGGSAHYVCSRGVCAIEGEIQAGGRDDRAIHQVGAWTCELTGASPGDAERFTTMLATREPQLSACGAGTLAMAVNRGYELVQLLAVDADRACVTEALVHLAVQADESSSIRCARH